MLIRLFLVCLLISCMVIFVKSCHSGQEKRRKRSLANNDEKEDVRLYFTACLNEQVGRPTVYDWKSNVDFTILMSIWYLNTEAVICSKSIGHDTAKCWSDEIMEYLNKDEVLAAAKHCIEYYFTDYSKNPPTPRYPRLATRSLGHKMQPISNSTIQINTAYASCVDKREKALKLNYEKLLPAIGKHAVIRKCDDYLRHRPLDYQLKFLALTRPDKRLRQNIEICNKRHLSPEYSWTSWSEWSSCSCNGVQQRNRKCVDLNSQNVGKAVNECQGLSGEVRKCAVYTCWVKWSAWTACPVTCGSGRKIRKRSCKWQSPDNLRPRWSCSRVEQQWINCRASPCSP